MSSCEQDCDAACDGAEPGECRSTCSHNCGEKCEQAECRDDDQAAACAPKCTTSCEGACRARASGDCQRSCQSQQFPACKTELVDRCHEACAQAGGAIFCGGQFLDAASVHACADELEEERLAHIDVGAAADGEGASGCSVARGGSGPFGLLVSLGALGLPRRRRTA